MNRNWLNPVLVLLGAFLMIFFEAWFEPLRNLLGAQVDFLPALTVYASLSCGLPTLTALALLGGVAFDCLSANPPGISVLPLFWVGLTMHQSRGLILREQKFAQFVLGAGASAAVPLLTLLLLFTSRYHPLVSWGTIWQLLVMSALGGAVTPLLFMAYDRLNLVFNYQPVSQSSFRPDREIKRGR